MLTTNMDHLKFIDMVVAEDVEHLREKERTYGGSWKRRGGVGAFMMLARKWDRLENMLRMKDGTQYDIFAAIAARAAGEDGSALAEIRDLRRYLTLVEAEMMSRGVVGLRTMDFVEILKKNLTKKTIPVHVVGDKVEAGAKLAEMMIDETIKDQLPPSLAIVPNTPHSEQTLEQLRAERAYWDRKIKESRGPASAVAAAEFCDECDQWIRIREAEKKTVPIEDSNRHADRAPRDWLNIYEYGWLPKEEKDLYYMDVERGEYRLKRGGV